MVTSLLGAGVAAAFFAILAGEYGGRKRLVYIFKPTAIGLILLAALTAPPSSPPLYRWVVAAGLALSAAGDVFLMLPSDRFRSGLACFLLAHVGYILAFLSRAPLGTAPWTGLPVLAAALAVLAFVAPRAGKLRWAVSAYGLVLAAMVWRAGAAAFAGGGAAEKMAFAGACLFLVSDSVLAVNRFIKPARAAQAVILSTYFAAQWLIASSL